MKKCVAFTFICFTLLACKDVMREQKKNDTKDSEQDTIPALNIDPAIQTANAIANAIGQSEWKDVSELKFTFNVDRGERHFERSWIWEPKNDIVKMIISEDTIRYHRVDMDSIQVGVDREFINDKYWLLAPFHLVWDTGKTLSEKQNQIAPISGDTMDVITITYLGEGGYTPGDAYDLYFGKDFLVKEWVFREGNDSLPTMATTWEDYEDFSGLKIAKMHRDSLRSFQLSFTNISVKK